jgi:translation initiation factor 4A
MDPLDTIKETIDENKDTMEFTNWDDLDINDKLLRGIYAYGYEKPSSIQSKTCRPIMTGRDVIAQSQSGTGKTASFVIGSLTKIDDTLDELQVIILSPTRELSIQIHNVITNLTNSWADLRSHCVVGGVHIKDDIQHFKRSIPHILVATTGRLLDLIKRRVINTRYIKMLVLDEADELLQNNFQVQIKELVSKMEQDIQILLFTATIPDEMMSVSKKFMRDPYIITIQSENLSLDGIKQYYCAVTNDVQKVETLKDIYSQISISQSIIYCNSVNRTMILYEELKSESFPVAFIHSTMDKTERSTIFSNFKSGKYRVLISTDITSRGIDIQQVGVVINFDIPVCKYTYLHRIGRSGRWGRKGIAINFVVNRDTYLMKDIETYYKCNIEELPANFSSYIA